MGPVLSGLTVKVTTFLKGAGVAALHCWFGEDLDDCLRIPRPTPSNAQPAPASDILLAVLPARPAPAVPRPARAATPRPTSASVGRSPPIAFARNERIPLLLEEDEHADWIIKQRAPPRLHTPRTNYTTPGSTRVNVRGVGTRSQQTSNTFRGYGPSQLRHYSIPPSPGPAASRQASSRQTTAPREVPLAPSHEYGAPQIQVTATSGLGPAELRGNIEVDTIVENSPIAETFVTANEGTRRNENSPLAASFVTAKEDNDVSDTETIKGATGTIKKNSADD